MNMEFSEDHLVNEGVWSAVICKGYYCIINGKVYTASTADELVELIKEAGKK